MSGWWLSLLEGMFLKTTYSAFRLLEEPCRPDDEFCRFLERPLSPVARARSSSPRSSSELIVEDFVDGEKKSVRRGAWLER